MTYETIQEYFDEVNLNQEIKMYDAIDIQRIFGFKNKYRAYDLMNSNGFPLIKINNQSVVERKSLEKWIKQNEGRKVKLN